MCYLVERMIVMMMTMMMMMTRKGTHQLQQRCRRKTLECRMRALVLSKPVYMFFLFFSFACIFFVCFYIYPTELLCECHLLIWRFHLNVNEEENENCHSCKKHFSYMQQKKQILL